MSDDALRTGAETNQPTDQPTDQPTNTPRRLTMEHLVGQAIDCYLNGQDEEEESEEFIEPTEEEYDELLDELYEPFQMGDVTLYPSEILKKCDPIAYRIGYDEYVDSRREDWEYENGR